MLLELQAERRGSVKPKQRRCCLGRLVPGAPPRQTLEAKTTEEKAIEAEIATLQQRLEDIRKEKETAQILATLKDAAEKTSFQRARGLEKKATKIATEKRTSTETLEKLDQSYEVSSREAAEQEAAALQASKSRVAAERRMQEKEGDAPRIVEAKDAVKKSRSARSAAERRVEEAKKRIQALQESVRNASAEARNRSVRRAEAEEKLKSLRRSQESAKEKLEELSLQVKKAEEERKAAEKAAAEAGKPSRPQDKS